MVPRPDVSEERKSQIVEAALVVFTRHGINGARMEDIAREVGLSKGTLYWYFDSKESLVFSMLEYLFGEYFQSVITDIPKVEGTVAERLTFLAEELVRYSQEMADLWPVSYEIYAWALREDSVREQVKQYFDASRDILSELIRQGIERGEFRPVDPEETALQIVAFNEGLQQLQALYGEDVDWRGLMLGAVNLIVSALKSEEREIF